ncbi:hypothetical protein RUM44_002891 [Polyplax serrata]|uniref:Uncharacterized protein n=1 Tax=Polyplax serrata TaxID=468196 RepID=A0ABR1AX20_POLSC
MVLFSATALILARLKVTKTRRKEEYGKITRNPKKNNKTDTKNIGCLSRAVMKDSYSKNISKAEEYQEIGEPRTDGKQLVWWRRQKYDNRHVRESTRSKSS